MHEVSSFWKKKKRNPPEQKQNSAQIAREKRRDLASSVTRNTSLSEFPGSV
jgi:hypothetical protein